MIDAYHSRRDYNLRCLYWKPAGLHEAVQELSHEDAPTGVFYAKYASGGYSSNSQATNVFQTEVSTISIKTRDDADLAPNDIVEFKGERWIVQNAQRIWETKSPYDSRAKETVVYLRKGL